MVSVLNLHNLGWLMFAAYLTGSIPCGLIVTRTFTDKDIYAEGSGNIGATNVRRVAGLGLGLLTLMADMLKGSLPVLLAAGIVESGGQLPADVGLSLVAVGAVTGHLFPLYLKGRGGGKGVATTAGCFLVLAPMALGIAAATFLMFCWCCNRVSAGSLSAAAVLPLAVWLTGHSGELIVCAICLALAITVRHRANIRRLLLGTEPPLVRKKSGF